MQQDPFAQGEAPPPRNPVCVPSAQCAWQTHQETVLAGVVPLWGAGGAPLLSGVLTHGSCSQLTSAPSPRPAELRREVGALRPAGGPPRPHTRRRSRPGPAAPRPRRPGAHRHPLPPGTAPAPTAPDPRRAPRSPRAAPRPARPACVQSLVPRTLRPAAGPPAARLLSRARAGRGLTASPAPYGGPLRAQKTPLAPSRQQGDRPEAGPRGGPQERQLAPATVNSREVYSLPVC